MACLKKFNLVVLWTTLGNCVNMQMSASITETSIFFNILETMHYIISKSVSTHLFMVKKCCLMNMPMNANGRPPLSKNLISSISRTMHDNIMKMVSTRVFMVKEYHTIT